MTQYTAANIVKGIDANKAPNFPTQIERGVLLNKILLISQYCRPSNYLPKIEKKIMKPAEIWITRRLPTRVLPRRPIFSLIQVRTKLTDHTSSQ